MINVASAARISLRALRVNKMRSALTMLGIIIGVGAVITMIAIGSGARKRLAEQISSMGSNLLMVLPGATTAGGIRMGAGTQPTLSVSDGEAIAREIPTVSHVAPILSGVAQVIYGSQNWATSIVGTSPAMLDVREWQLDSGRVFTDEEMRSAAKVCLLGQTVVDNLFGDADPLGQIVRIKKIPFSVIGVLGRKGQTPNGQDQDDTIYVPVTAAQKKLFGTAFPGMVRFLMVKARSLEDLPAAEKQVAELIRQRHRIGLRQEDDFTVRNLTQFMQTAQQQTNVMTLLLGAIASVSLLVGGIGIMNIMLVSVTERTKEIGIRMAVGARTWDIRTQFLIEALVLSLIGGLIGIIIGISSSYLVSYFAGWAVDISVFSVVLSFGFSGIVGMFFGFYPAYKASLLDPIEALRYE